MIWRDVGNRQRGRKEVLCTSLPCGNFFCTSLAFSHLSSLRREKLHILAHIRKMVPGFNIGVSMSGDLVRRWSDPYRHWNFKPKEHRVDGTKFKATKNPI
jgi:hypothetical protein